MNTSLKRLLVYFLAVSIMAIGWPSLADSQRFVIDGAKSSEEAAKYKAPLPQLSPAITNSLGFKSLLSDTTQAVYYEEEEQRNLVKEMIVWFIGAAFVGYFIVKVFLQGDTDEDPPATTGKQLPQTNLFLPSSHPGSR